MFANCLYVTHALLALIQLKLEIGLVTKESEKRKKLSHPRQKFLLFIAEVAHLQYFRSYIHLFFHDSFGEKDVNECLVRVEVSLVQI